MGIFGAEKVSQVTAQDAKAMVESYFEKRGMKAADFQLSDAGGLG